MTYLSVMQFFVQGYFSRIAFNREVEKNYKMITMLCSVEGQASCTDEGYLLIIKVLRKIDQNWLEMESSNQRLILTY